MQGDAPLPGFDEIDPGVLAGLTCHIEIEMTGGQTARDVAAQTAETLRELAIQIEGGKFDTGFHRVITKKGVDVGELYLDFYGELTSEA